MISCFRGKNLKILLLLERLYVTVKNAKVLLYIYVNGVFDATPISATQSPWNPSDQPVNIGKHYEYFSGIIDEVRIYNRVLSTDEIKANYQKKVAMEPIEKGPVAYWGFDEGEGILTADYSGRENHGRLQGNMNWAKPPNFLDCGDSSSNPSVFVRKEKKCCL